MSKFSLFTLSPLRRGLLAVAGATLVLGSVTAYGQAAAHPHDMATMSAEDMGRMRQRMLDRAASELTLDATQKQRLATVFDKLAEQRKAVMGQDADPRARARALIAGNTFDRAGAQQLIDQKTSAVRSGAPEVITAFGDFYDNLKPEQQQKVRVWMDKRGGHRWFGGPGGMNGMGGHEMHRGPHHGMAPGSPPADTPPAPPAAPRQ